MGQQFWYPIIRRKKLIIIPSNDSKLILIESTKFYDSYCPEVPESCSDYKWEPVPAEIGRWQQFKVAKHGEVEAHVRLLCSNSNYKYKCNLVCLRGQSTWHPVKWHFLYLSIFQVEFIFRLMRANKIVVIR